MKVLKNETIHHLQSALSLLKTEDKKEQAIKEIKASLLLISKM
jgi:hypothetical protein